MSETETLSPVTADVATIHEAPATTKKQIQIPKAPKAQAPQGTRDHNLTIIDPKIKLGGGYSDAEKDELTKL